MSSFPFEDFTVDLHRSVGMPVGAEFSSEDVKRLYSSVFHVPSNAGEAQRAMKKVAGGDQGWSCVGGNVVEVLLEMEREREKNQQLLWDLQLLNAGKQSPDTDSHTANNQSDSGSVWSRQSDPDNSQMGRLGGRKGGMYGSVRRLKKAARQCWARLASEGVQAIVSLPWKRGSPGVKVQAWGCVSLSDVLLLVDVKFDVVTHLLYSEMLQEHHTPCSWRTLLPWQRHREHEGLEDFAEEALISGDLLSLAELPGAFRIYRDCRGASLERSCSAISLLYELHARRQQERDTVTALGERLDREGMRLLCLHVRLATLRAQREVQSHAALLAARQAWEAWPHMSNPCRSEQAVLWLQGEEKEQKDDLPSASPQQRSVLHLLVLSQEQERKHLVRLVRGVSLEELQGEACSVSSAKESSRDAAFRNCCVERLREIHGSLQTHTETRVPLEQPLPSTAQPQVHPQIISPPAPWTQHQVETCALLLLTRLLELQDAQASALLPELMDMSVQHLQVLEAKYESELQAQNFTNLLQLLMPEGPGTTVPPPPPPPLPPPPPNLINSSNEQLATQNSQPQNSGYGLVQEVHGTNQQDVCTGCGAVMEELPYLEICVSDSTISTCQSAGAENEAQEGGRESTTSEHSYEKQGSLITLAWSKPPAGDTDYEAESADGGTVLSVDSGSSVQSGVPSSDTNSTDEHMHSDESSGVSHDEEPGSSTDRRLTLEEQLTADRPHNDDAVSECVPHASQDVPPQALVDLPRMKPHTDDLCPGLSSETADTGGDGFEVEPCPTAVESDLWDLKEPDHTDNEDQSHSSQTNAACDLTERPTLRESTLTEREQMREPVSAIERERTMRNLVDMQKNIEQRHQRDRERQLLRVQERLSIIQNKKAEEDLLGLKHTDRMKHLTQDLPQEDKKQQKTVVRERLEQLRRERSYVMQSKRDRNTAGFKELLGPVTVYRESEDVTD